MKVDRKKHTLQEIFTGVYGYNKPYTAMKANLNGRIALITGAGGMIGGAAASLMAASGATIAVWDIRDDAGEKKVQEIVKAGGAARYYHVDVTDKAAMKAGVDRVIKDFKKIDILLCNAGINRSNRKPVIDFDDDDLQPTIDCNLGQSYFLSKCVIPGMISQGGGSIVHTTSICGVTGLRRQSAFVYAKFAISALTRSMALEYAKYNIRVNALAPGSLPSPDAPLNFLWDTCDFDDYDSNFSNPSSMVFDIPARRPAHPKDMAGLLLYLVSDDAVYTTGQVICVDGGWTAGYSGDY